MLEILGFRQKELLKLLLKNKAGMTADELSLQLAITRNAVRQHLAALESDGLVKKAATRASGGRPEQLYALTEQGLECFPRHYDWFAQLLIDAISLEDGREGFEGKLEAIGAKVGTQLRAQHAEQIGREERIQKLAELMAQLGYSARSGGAKTNIIEADNCVFHTLAVANPKVCRFDLAMLSAFVDGKVDHQECMAKGGNLCRFKFSAK